MDDNFKNQNNLKTLFITRQLTIGGQERQLFYLLKNINRSRFNPIVLFLDDYPGMPGFKDEILSLNIQVYHLPKYSKWDITVFFRWWKLIHRISPDVVFCFSANYYGAFASIFAGVKRLIVSERVSGFWRKWYHVYFERLLYKKVFAVVCNSIVTSRKISKQLNIPLNKIKVVYNGIDVKSNDFLKARLVSETISIGIVGRVVLHKGHKTIIDALGNLINEFDLKLNIVGRGDNLQNLQKMIEEKVLAAYVEFIPETHDIDKEYDKIDILINASFAEGLPNVILEAMARKIPVIATAVDGNKELVIHKETGLLFTPGDSDALTDQIRLYLNDKILAEKMSDNAYNLVRNHFSMKKMVRLMEEVIICST